jgi:tripartite-type tricarboxylate transporter receptor subunit TctC
MQIRYAALVEACRQLVLGKARPARRRHRAHIDQQFYAGALQFVEHRLGRRLLIADGEEAFGLAGHIGPDIADAGRTRLRHGWIDFHIRVAAGRGLPHSRSKPSVDGGRAGGNTMNRFCRVLASTLALLASGVATGHAQTGYPDHPVKIIVPIAPGGSYDLVGRHIADALSKRMGQAFVVENKPGAGTVVGTQAASQSEPDGYTLLVGGLSNMAFNSALYSKLGYDPLKDFVPVALVYKFGYVMVGRKDLPHAKLRDLVAAAKANPGSISVATAGVGTGQQLAAAAFMKAAGVKFLEVPYKGSPPAFTDLLAGRIDLFFDSMAAGLPYVQSGQARGIAVLSSKRSALAPDVPTMSEAGVPGLDVDSWLGIFAPAKTPPDIIAKLRRDIRAVLPELKERFEKSGGEAWDLPDDKVNAFVASEYETWTKLIREAGIKLD